MKDPRLLFVCTGNTGRSVCAETLTRLQLQARGLEAAVFSRGLSVDPSHRGAEAPALALWARRGVDLSRHVAQSLEAADAQAADVILCATREHRDQVLARYPAAGRKAFTLAQYAGSGAELEDAFGKPMVAYQAMLTELERQIPLIIDRLLAEFETEPR